MRPTQVFKKRNNLFSTTVLNNANAVLISEIVMRETGTLYSVKISAYGEHVSGANLDVQRIELWCRCVPAVTGLPDLTVAVEQDTMNGFYVGQIVCDSGCIGAAAQMIPTTKFRFRRKCDENSLLQLIAQSTDVGAVGRSVIVSGLMAAVIRVK